MFLQTHFLSHKISWWISTTYPTCIMCESSDVGPMEYRCYRVSRKCNVCKKREYWAYKWLITLIMESN